MTSIVETWQDAIFSLTTESRKLSWNAAAEKLLGYTRQEANAGRVRRAGNHK